MISTNSPLILVHLWSHDCPSCEAMATICEETGEALSLPYVSLNIEEYPDLVEELCLYMLPTYLVFSDGDEVGRIEGTLEEYDFIRRIAQILNDMT